MFCRQQLTNKLFIVNPEKINRKQKEKTTSVVRYSGGQVRYSGGQVRYSGGQVRSGEVQWGSGEVQWGSGEVR